MGRKMYGIRLWPIWVSGRRGICPESLGGVFSRATIRSIWTGYLSRRMERNWCTPCSCIGVIRVNRRCGGSGYRAANGWGPRLSCENNIPLISASTGIPSTYVIAIDPTPRVTISGRSGERLTAGGRSRRCCSRSAFRSICFIRPARGSYISRAARRRMAAIFAFCERVGRHDG
jgi:hypothetical protein